MSFQTQYALRNDSAFQEKVKMAVLKSALAVVGETPADPANVAVDTKRHTLGLAALTEGADGSTSVRFINALAAVGTLSAASTDADVEFTVNAVWNDLAGVTGAEAAV